MQVREIRHDRWQRFFEDFSRSHHGKRVNVECMAAGNTKSWCADKPLMDIVNVDEAPASSDRIHVIAGDLPSGCTTYGVSDPRHVWVAKEENGLVAGLQIDSADGSVTVIRFEPPVEGMPFGFRFA